MPIVEHGLPELVQQETSAGRLTFGLDSSAAAAQSDFVFLCLPTPEGADGHADLSFVEQVAFQIGTFLRPGACVITKSTVPVGTHAVVEAALGRDDVHVVSNPEFLAEGSAVRDCLDPDRVVVGARDPAVAASVALLFGPGAMDRSIITDLPSAELIKYASNAYLATRLTFVNSIAELCEKAGADIRSVVAGMGSDSRIGEAFLRPGPGWGGSCFPKDTQALVRTADRLGCDLALVKAAIDANAYHTARVFQKMMDASGGAVKGKRVAVWGLTFKAGTNDLRQSPALALAEMLLGGGATVHAYDPTVEPGLHNGVEAHSSALAACRNADALLVATEWPEFAEVEMRELAAIMRGRVIVDARNLLDADAVSDHGFVYHAVGMAPRHPGVQVTAAV